MKLRFVEKSFFIHAYIVGNVQTCILNTSIKNKTNSKRSGVVKPDEKNIKLTTNYTIIYKIKKENLLRYTKTLVNIGIKMN